MKKYILAFLVAITLLISATACSQTQLESEKYALVVVGSMRGSSPETSVDGLDDNGFWLGGVRVYAALKRLGFKVENIRFLFPNRYPDFTEYMESETIKDLRREQFNGSYDNLATRNNIDKQIQMFAKIVKPKDIFVVYFGTHGAETMLEIEAENNASLNLSGVQRMLEKVHPMFGLFYSDACHSGAFIKQLNLPNFIAVSTTTEKTYGWGDRFFSGGSFFFQALSDPLADVDTDGLITIEEAMKYSQEKADAHMKRIDKYLKNEYNWDMPFSYREDIEKGKVSVQQRIKYGKNINKGFVLFDTGLRNRHVY